MRDLALAYVARFSTSAARLEAYLLRKIRERGFVFKDASDEIDESDEREGVTRAFESAAVDVTDEIKSEVERLIERLVELGYVDDALYARSRSRDLLARGYGTRRVDQALWAAGIDEDVRGDLRPSEAAMRRAAILLARKRRFGPFDAEEIDRARREKQVAAMLRAGHGMDIVRRIIGSPSEADLADWLAEAEDGSEAEGWAET